MIMINKTYSTERGMIAPLSKYRPTGLEIVSQERDMCTRQNTEESNLTDSMAEIPLDLRRTTKLTTIVYDVETKRMLSLIC